MARADGEILSGRRGTFKLSVDMVFALDIVDSPEESDEVATSSHRSR